MTSKSILLTYSGYEQGTWGDIAFRREQYYHYFPGIVYLATALKNAPETREWCDVTTCHNNTTVESFENILERLVARSPDCVGFACYCWNIDLHARLATAVKQALPDVRVLFGGPEITMKTSDECRAFFEQWPCVDLCVIGEAETRIPVLVTALMTGVFDGLADESGYAFHPRFGEHADLSLPAIPRLSEIPSIYPHEIEVRRSEGCGISIVYEASRGCPNKCIYCEFVKWRTRQESFPFERVERELTWILEQEIDGIHFADAVFDRDADVAARLLELLIRHNRRTTLFCYASFNTLDSRLADLFEKSRMQIGVGVQSTDETVLRTIRRGLSTRLFREAPAILKERSVNFYTDLMFGLPGDSPETFRRSFDMTLGLDPAFMMLFPLSLIRGTSLGDSPQDYAIRSYTDEQVGRLGLACDIEYLNVGLGENFGLEDLKAFDDVAVTCFYYYNRFPHCLGHLQKRRQGSAFDLYRLIGAQTKDYLARTGRRATNTGSLEGFQEEIHAIFRGVLRDLGAGENEIFAFGELFKLDLFRLVVVRSPHREKVFLQNAGLGLIDELPETLEDSSRFVRTTFGKAITLEFALEDLLGLHELRESISQAKSCVYVHAPFGHANTSVRRLNEEQTLLIDLLTGDRGIRLKSLVSSLNQHFRRRDTRGRISGEEVRDLLALFWKEDAVRMVKEK